MDGIVDGISDSFNFSASGILGHCVSLIAHIGIVYATPVGPWILGGFENIFDFFNLPFEPGLH